jgi:hypothetical protein
VLSCVLLTATVGRADDIAVPVALQAELVAKVAAYDKNLPARAGNLVRVLIVVKGGDDASGRFGKHMTSALAGIDRIGGLPHEEATTVYASSAAIAETCRARRISIVYLAPGLGGDVAEIRTALDKVNVLTVAAVASEVPKGIVLGFDLVSGKPKIVVHLAQARRQEVQFRAELLKLAKVID